MGGPIRCTRSQTSSFKDSKKPFSFRAKALGKQGTFWVCRLRLRLDGISPPEIRTAANPAGVARGYLRLWLDRFLHIKKGDSPAEIRTPVSSSRGSHPYDRKQNLRYCFLWPLDDGAIYEIDLHKVFSLFRFAGCLNPMFLEKANMPAFECITIE